VKNKVLQKLSEARAMRQALRRAPWSSRSPFKSLDKKLQITLDVKGPIADTWSRDHSAFYRSLYLCLATTNDLLLAIGYTRIIGKEFSNATRFQFNSYDLMHKQ
jgi:hypothetical protein